MLPRSVYGQLRRLAHEEQPLSPVATVRITEESKFTDKTYQRHLIR